MQEKKSLSQSLLVAIWVGMMTPYPHYHYFVFFSHPDLWFWNTCMLICLLQKLSATQDLYCSKIWIHIMDQAHHRSSFAPEKLVCFRTVWRQSEEPAGFITRPVCTVPNAAEPWLQRQWESGFGRSFREGAGEGKFMHLGFSKSKEGEAEGWLPKVM